MGWGPPFGFSWPGLPGPGIFAPAEPTARDAGYSCCPDLTAGGEDWEFVHVGQVMGKDDQFWKKGVGPWVRLDSDAVSLTDIDRPVTSLHYPVRRKKVPVGPPKWKCRHGRDPGATHCVVCAVVYYRLVEE